jgi:uncharacterized spore protein YtfJ
MGPSRPFGVLRRALRARDVFGKPVKSGGVTVIPVAAVSGGGGGSAGEQSKPGTDVKGIGGVGFGFKARPVGAYVIRDGKASWRPAVDVTRLALGAMVAGVVVAGLVIKKG